MNTKLNTRNETIAENDSPAAVTKKTREGGEEKELVASLPENYLFIHVSALYEEISPNQVDLNEDLILGSNPESLQMRVLKHGKECVSFLNQLIFKKGYTLILYSGDQQELETVTAAFNVACHAARISFPRHQKRIVTPGEILTGNFFPKCSTILESREEIIDALKFLDHNVKQIVPYRLAKRGENKTIANVLDGLLNNSVQNESQNIEEDLIKMFEDFTIVSNASLNTAKDFRSQFEELSRTMWLLINNGDLSRELAPFLFYTLMQAVADGDIADLVAQIDERVPPEAAPELARFFKEYSDLLEPHTIPAVDFVKLIKELCDLFEESSLEAVRHQTL